MNTLFNTIVVTTFLTLLFLLNILIFLSPTVFQFAYPMLTEPDNLGWSSEIQTQRATSVAQMLINEEPFQAEQLSKYEIEMSESEQSHMTDVGKLLIIAKVAAAFVAGILIATLTKAHKAKKLSRLLIQKLLKKAFITYLVIAVVACIVVITLWSFFFTTFHQLLFTPGTWTFPTDSTLIRLFPESFWQKTFTMLIVLPIIECAFLFIPLFARKTLQSDKITS